MGGCASTSDTTPSAENVMSDTSQVLDQQFYADSYISNPAELHIACEGLLDLDVASKSDPYAILFARDKLGYRLCRDVSCRQWVKIGATEVINDNLNPKFVKSIVVKYMFEERQIVSPPHHARIDAFGRVRR